MTVPTIRPMAKADLPQVTLIEQACQSHPWSLLQFLDGFNAGHHGWVVSRQDGGREVIIGFAIVATVLDESTLLNLCVAPSQQQQGIGRHLLDFVLARARREHVSRIILEVRVSNRPAMSLYESMGFERISVRRDYYPAVIGREDGAVYSLSLASGE